MSGHGAKQREKVPGNRVEAEVPEKNLLQRIGLGALVFCACVVAYLPSLSGSFIWNDSDYVTARSLRSFEGLQRIWVQLGSTQQYYPLLHSAFWIQHLSWGDSPLGYHLVNVLLHAFAATLFGLVLGRLSVPGAWLAAVLFAVHPVHVQSVAWITEQKNTLSLLFYLGAALVYLEYDAQHRFKVYVAAFALFALALLSKTSTATLPAALLVVFWWKRGQLSWRRDLLPLLPWLVVGAAVGIFSSWVERVYGGAQGQDFTASPLERVLVAGRAIWFYARHLVWPLNLNFIYPRWVVNSGDWSQWLYPIAVVALGGALWAIRRRARAPFAVFLIFVGSLFPVLGFVNLYGAEYSWVWDHWQYLADLAPLALLAAGLSLGWERTAIGIPWLGATLAAVLVVTLTALTWSHGAMFSDNLTLYRATLERNPGCWLAHNNLGNELLKIRGRSVDAVAQYEEALRIKPDYFEAHMNLGNVWMTMPDRLSGAIAQFNEALRLSPDSAQAHDSLGNALFRLSGGQNDALVQYQEAVRLNPGDAEAHSNLGIALAQMPGRLEESLEELTQAIRLRPGSPKVHENLGSVLAEIPGHLDEAVSQYREALLLEPEDPQAHYNFGTILVRDPGRVNDAASQFEEAVRLDPGFADARYNLAIAYLGMPGRAGDAVAQLEEVVALRPDDPEAHYDLALALSKLPGREDETRAHLEAVLRLQPNNESARRLLEGLLAPHS